MLGCIYFILFYFILFYLYDELLLSNVFLRLASSVPFWGGYLVVTTNGLLDSLEFS